MIKFTLPDETHRDDVLDFYAGFERRGESCVGYAVRRSERNRGVAAEMLEQGLRLARSFGLERVLAVCGEDNCAAQKVVARNSGVFENKMYDEEEKAYVNRFWIDLRPSMT